MNLLALIRCYFSSLSSLATTAIAMGKKLEEISEPVAHQETANGHKTDKKKKKNKIKNQLEPDQFQETQQMPSLKRKLEETQNQETVKKDKKIKKKHKEENVGLKQKEREEEFQESSKKDKKKKKENKEEENGKENRSQEELLKQEEKVVVSGKDSQEAKYVPLKSFAESNLPDNVLECCKNFKNPSPIQAHAWPFLFDGRDFVGIAKTGSGRVMDWFICMFVLF